mmetsp:Transcript_14055/g.38411  ORF Transcript_14055/g.38411 Transcript_14055/m.38411 type:complete len:205 (-) Transcript_14055:1858-2472(-)
MASGCCIKNAAHITAERFTPATQCTSTALPFSRHVWMNATASSNVLQMGWSGRSNTFKVRWRKCGHRSWFWYQSNFKGSFPVESRCRTTLRSCLHSSMAMLRIAEIPFSRNACRSSASPTLPSQSANPSRDASLVLTSVMRVMPHWWVADRNGTFCLGQARTFHGGTRPITSPSKSYEAMLPSWALFTRFTLVRSQLEWVSLQY